MVLTTFAEIGAGALLSDLRAFYRMLPGILIVVPGLMELRGNIATSLAQRLGSALHMGVIGWERGLNPELKQNLRASIFLSITISVILGFAGWAILRLTGEQTIGPLQIVFVTLGVASLAGFLQAFLTTGVAMYAAHRGVDPDNVTIPILATIGDILTVVFLLLIVRLLLLISG
jgi:mgtE-like transporter